MFVSPLLRRLLSSAAVATAFFALAALPARAQTTYTVTNTNSSGSGSLAAAVASVDAGTGGDTIDFASGVTGTITLTNGTLTLRQNVTITGPSTSALTISGGGAVTVFTVSSRVTASISGLTIADGNNYGGFGGGIANYGALTVSNSTFSGNTAGGGGGIFNGGTLTVSNSTFSGNTASGGYGGGIANDGKLTVSNSTFSGNTANGGGGISVNSSGSATITNSIVAGNTTTGNPGDDCDGCGTQRGNLISTSSSSPSPMLGPLQYNGGPTETMMPLTGSPALNAGSGSTLSTDQRGFYRPTGSGVTSDLGAVEVYPFTVTTTTDSTNSGTSCYGGATCSLRDAITLANSETSGDIQFASGLTGTITLTSALPPITATNINITGPGANLLTISGGGTMTVFTVNSGVTATISGLTITGGGGSSSGSGILNNGTLTVSNSTLSGNTTGSGNGYGGGIDSYGTLTVSNSTFSNNTASNPGGGGGIANYGTTMTVSNSTFFGNTAASGGNGGGIFNGGSTLTVSNSTFFGNTASTGGGIYSQVGGFLGTSTTITNSIVAGNTTTNAPGDDCDSCTLSGKNLVSTPGNIQNPMLGALAYNGTNQTVQTLLPLPGSPAIEAGLASTLTTDERGLPRPHGSGVVSDLGAVQTNYTAVQFVQQPTNTLINATMAPAVTLSVMESGAAAVNIPVPLTLSGNGTLAGTLTETTLVATPGSAAMATYSNLSVNAAGTGDTLSVSLPITATGVTPPLTLKASSSSFDITLQTTTITWTAAPPASVVYGTGPIMLAATASNGATVSYQVISGPATITGSTLSFTGAGSVVIEAYTTASGNYAAGSLTANITVTAAPPIPPSYTMTASPSSLTIAAGKSGTTTITFTPVGGYTGSVTLSCGTLPAFVKCTFTQGGTANSTVAMTGNDATITVVLTISTNVSTALNVLPSILQTPGARPATLLAASKTPTPSHSPMNPILPALAFWGPGGLAGLAAFGRKRKLTKKQFGFLQLGLLVLLTGALAAGLSGCDGMDSTPASTTNTSVTPAGTSAVVITAAPTSGTAQTLTLSVTITG